MIRDVSFQEVGGHKHNFISLGIPDVSQIWIWQVNYAKLLEMNFFYLVYLFTSW
jgi:hypothetical protein